MEEEQLRLLGEISSKLDILEEINSYIQSLEMGIQTLVYIGGAIIALQLVSLFAKAWGRNT